MKNQTTFFLFYIALFFTSCGTYFNQPLTIQKPTLGEGSSVNIDLKSLPKASEPVVVGVYKFRDQTGQYKESESGSTFSTAVTQGATTILIKALEDSKWFVPIERENLANLLNERNIIKSTRQEYTKGTEPATDTQLSPLLYAGVLLEGGIVSYDSNILTGGFGARYFGTGASTKYRQDRISVYLRLVSTSNGKILKTVYVSKTILSQAIDASLFKYVDFKRLLEIETGYTKNEPVHMAVTEAIEKAVTALVIEGIRDNIWKVNAPEEKVTQIVKEYEKEKDIASQTEMFSRNLFERRGKYALEFSGGGTLINDDYKSPEPRAMIKGGLKYFISPTFNVAGSINAYWLGNKNKLEASYGSFDLNLEAIVLPFDNLTPFLYAGVGYNANNRLENQFYKAQFGGGLEYMTTNNLGFKIFAESNISNTDNIDYLIKGVKNDSFLRFGFGFNYYFGKRKVKNKTITTVESNLQQTSLNSK